MSHHRALGIFFFSDSRCFELTFYFIRTKPGTNQQLWLCDMVLRKQGQGSSVCSLLLGIASRAFQRTEPGLGVGQEGAILARKRKTHAPTYTLIQVSPVQTSKTGSFFNFQITPHYPAEVTRNRSTATGDNRLYTSQIQTGKPS